MKEMSREKKIEKVSAILLGKNVMLSNCCTVIATEILDAIETPKTRHGYEELFDYGTSMQLLKLIEHKDDKEGWDDIDLDFAGSEIEDNVRRLEDLISGKDISPYVVRSDLDNIIIITAANIANFAHMIIYKLFTEEIAEDIKKQMEEMK